MKTVFFYSFKGGVGRTQMMMNTANYLSIDKNKKIAIIDFDIYAPGISYLCKFNGEKKNDYLLDFLVKLFKGEKSNLYYEQLEDNNNLFIVPSFQVDNFEGYHEILNELSQYLYAIKHSTKDREKEIETVADKIYKYLKLKINEIYDDFDYIFIDGRTGITEISDIFFSNFVDLKVMISSYNYQNLTGTEKIIELISKQKGTKHNILRVLSPKPKKSRFEYSGILSSVDLSNKIVKDKLNWLGTFELPYEEEIVTNDKNAWAVLDEANQYKQGITFIANKIDDFLTEDVKLYELLDNINK